MQTDLNSVADDAVKNQLLSSFRYKTTLLGSIFFSLCLHVSSLFLLQHQSLWFASSRPIETKATPWIVSMEKREANQILKEAFHSSFSISQIADALPLQSPEQESIANACYLNTPLPSLEEDSKFLSVLIPPSPMPPNELLSSPLALSLTLPPEETVHQI